MPTGYTAKIKDGITFQEFALDCARAFGACVMLRDEPGGGENIPAQFEPSDYNAKALETARFRAASLAAMTPDECEAAALADYTEAEARRMGYLAERNQQRGAYEAMLAKVKAWKPPTAEHEGMKTFMVQQITESIKFDCGDYYETPTVRRSGTEWLAHEKAEAERLIAYHEKAHREEVERTNSRNAWITALRASLA